MLFRSVLLVSFVCYFCIQASKTKTSQKCITSLRTLSARVSHVPWVVPNNAENYSSTSTICDFSEPMFEDCCAVSPIQFGSTSNPPELEQLRIQWLEPVSAALLNHSLYLQRYFIECLNLTMAALDVSFQSSYGYNYQNNKEFFVHFFDDLESYMLGYRQNLSQMVDNFFDELLKRIVRLLWFAKSQDDLVIADCISAELQQHSPFGRIPEGIKRMAIRAFPPARMTANALLVGSETISNALNEVNLVYSCHINWMKLRYCKFCFGEPLASICPDDCQQQITLCMNDYYSLDDPWTHFIDSLLELINRLRGSDSFPQVNRPLQIHITDAIMSFQRLFSRIDPTLLKKCGYSRRNTNTTRSRQRRHLYSVERGIFSSVPETVDYFRVLPSLENQTKLMRNEYLSVRSLFSNLEKSFCSPQLLHYPDYSGKSVYTCWNGNRMSSTRLTSNRPKPQPTKPNPVIQRLSIRLQATTHLLQTVLNDNADPDFVPLEDSQFIDRLHSLWDRESKKRLSNPTSTSPSLDAKVPNEYFSGVSNPSI
ncbi:hypothetical protein FBUS_09076 [Fasciolopsis buskii]|uniref:Uncharacterized protein n=1 Tax=Fasciolopsis buskii TaxID=27845 RepID=A0A8E0RS03_9TREM|nr:hypothetical protein FBUS_09076 [Fasciolopsis buski]